MSGIFPITDREASVLHDLKWNSGFGWKDEFDWWPSWSEVTAAESDDVRLLLVRHLTMIRAAVTAGEQLAKRILSLEASDVPL